MRITVRLYMPFYYFLTRQPMYKYYNPNPDRNLVGDCVIRAISKLTEQDWETTYIDIVLQGFLMKDMPSSNSVWAAYLKDNGYSVYIIPNTCPDCYTIKDFCIDFPQGKYLLAMGSHVVAVENGDYYDTWDSGMETPIYYWTKGD